MPEPSPLITPPVQGEERPLRWASGDEGGFERVLPISAGKAALGPAGSEPLARDLGNNSVVALALASEKSGRLCGRTPTPSRGGRGSPAPAPGQRRCWLQHLLLAGSGLAAPLGCSSPEQAGAAWSGSSPAAQVTQNQIFCLETLPRLGGTMKVSINRQHLSQTCAEERTVWLDVGSWRCLLTSGGISSSFQRLMQ